ncbi:MAG: phosphatase PAP2 family protein [Acidiferrobacteraceae bacterium]
MKQVLYGWYGGNAWLFRVLSSPHGRHWTRLMRLASDLADHSHVTLYSILLCFLGVIAVGSGLRRDHGEAAAFRWFTVLCVFTVGTVLDHVAVEALKGWFALPRPGASPGFAHAFHDGALSGTFPSGHASFAAVFAVSVWPTARVAVRAALIAAVVLVCLSRVSLGLHFPADVIAGAAIGWLIAASVQRSLSLLWRMAAPEKPAAP